MFGQWFWFNVWLKRPVSKLKDKCSAECRFPSAKGKTPFPIFVNYTRNSRTFTRRYSETGVLLEARQ